MDQLTPMQKQELYIFAYKNGRNWKSKLLKEWDKPNCNPILRQVRNSFGPSWLLKQTIYTL